MSFTALGIQTAGTAGTALGTTAATVGGTAFGNAFQNDGATFIRSENTGTDIATVTVVTGAELAGQPVDDVPITLAGSGTATYITTHGPYPRNVFNQQSGDDRGKVRMSVSGAGSADVVYSAFR